MEHALNNLRHALRDFAAKLGLPAFWRWWMGEFASIAPGAARAAVQRRRLRPVLAFGDGEAVLWAPRVVDGALVLAEAGRVSTGGDPAAVAQAGRALVDVLRRPRADATVVKAVIALPRAQILRKQLTLPAAVEENLKEALAYDLDRHTPFRPDQLYFDAVVIARDPAKKEIRVDWAAALRTTVDAARRHAENWGALVVGVTPEAADAGWGTVMPPARWSKLDLLPEEQRPEVVFWRRPRILVPAALLAVMALVAVVLPIWQKRDYVIALSETTEQARVQAAASDALREQLERATGDYNFALSKKYAYPSMVQLIDDVTKILPDDTWLTQLEVKSVPKGKESHREIVLRGESANAGLLVSALEASKLVEQAAPRSPTTKIQPGPGEVFDLGAQLKTQPPPALIQLVSSARPVPTTQRGEGPPAPPAAAGSPAGAAAPAAAPAPNPAAPNPANRGVAPLGPAAAPAGAASAVAKPVTGESAADMPAPSARPAPRRPSFGPRPPAPRSVSAEPPAPLPAESPGSEATPAEPPAPLPAELPAPGATPAEPADRSEQIQDPPPAPPVEPPQ